MNIVSCQANEIVEGANQAAKDEKWFFDIGAEPQLRYGSTSSRQRNMQALSGIDADVSLGIIPASISGKPSSLANACNRLLVLQEISTIMLACQHNEYEKEKLFFSMLGSVHTVSDCLFRRLRGLLMVVSNDCIKLELLGDNTLEAPPKKSKEKSGGGCHKGKNKGRNLNRSNSGHKSSRPLQNPQKVFILISKDVIGFFHSCKRFNSDSKLLNFRSMEVGWPVVVVLVPGLAAW